MLVEVTKLSPMMLKQKVLCIYLILKSIEEIIQEGLKMQKHFFLNSSLLLYSFEQEDLLWKYPHILNYEIRKN